MLVFKRLHAFTFNIWRAIDETSNYLLLAPVELKDEEKTHTNEEKQTIQSSIARVCSVYVTLPPCSVSASC